MLGIIKRLLNSHIYLYTYIHFFFYFILILVVVLRVGVHHQLILIEKYISITAVSYIITNASTRNAIISVNLTYVHKEFNNYIYVNA